MNSRLWSRVAFLVAVVIIASALPPTGGGHSKATAAPTLMDLGGVEDLKQLFNQDNGTVRLVMLMSPT